MMRKPKIPEEASGREGRKMGKEGGIMERGKQRETGRGVIWMCVYVRACVCVRVRVCVCA